MRASIMGLCLLLASSLAIGGNGTVADVQKRIEASLRVTGSLEVDASGTVVGHRIDQAAQLDRGVLALIEDTLPHWRFEPVLEDGQPRAVQADMSLLLVADKTDDGQMRVRIQSAHFGKANTPATDRVRIASRTALKYPDAAERADVGATVYLALRIDREGNVVDALAQQVNLRYLDSERKMARWREAFARPTAARVKTWKLQVPTTGPYADAPYFTAILPVEYTAAGALRSDVPGTWRPYVPGPRAEIAWLDPALQRSSGAEALADGQLAQLGTGLKLLTPLDEG